MSYGGGYNCGVCGVWVPLGVVHMCGGTAGSYRADPTWMLLNAIQDLKNELQRIALALERVAAKGKP